MGEEKTAFGRQVVIVNPSYLVKTIVIQKLLEMEYEVYYVDSPRSAKGVLRVFPTAICLIDVDTAMASDEFLNFIASIEREGEFPDVLVGVLTRRTMSLQKKFTQELDISAGIINTSTNKEALIDELTTLFNSYNVKGRRQFVRVSLTNASGAQFYCKIQGIPVHFPLRDISSCGFACEAAGYPEAAFTVKSLIQGELQLGNTILPCSVVLFAIKPAGKSLLLVMLFSQTNAWSNKKTIRSFIAETMQKKIDEVRVRSEPDDKDYSKPDENLPPKKKPDGVAPDSGNAQPDDGQQFADSSPEQDPPAQS